MKFKDDRLGQRMRRLSESRDVWKQRVTEKQSMIRYLRVKVRDLEASRDLWKNRATTKIPTNRPATSLGRKRSMDEMTAGE